METKSINVNEYLASAPDDARARFEELRRVVNAVAPDAAETISYAMPIFTYRGRRLVYFAAWKGHCALYGVDVVGHADELTAFKTSKGTIRFSTSEPLPADLVERLVLERKDQIDRTAAGKRGGSPS